MNSDNNTTGILSCIHEHLAELKNLFAALIQAFGAQPPAQPEPPVVENGGTQNADASA